MGYQILYSPEKKDLYPEKAQRRPRNRTLMLCLILGAVLLLAVGSGATERLRESLLPDDFAKIKEAASVMIGRIRTGASVGESLEAFCVEIVGHGLQAA